VEKVERPGIEVECGTHTWKSELHSDSELYFYMFFCRKESGGLLFGLSN
jgi:hypothetical protein